METFSALLALCAENSPVTGEFPSQRPVTQSFDVFFDGSINNREAGDSIHHRAHYEVTVMSQQLLWRFTKPACVSLRFSSEINILRFANLAGQSI